MILSRVRLLPNIRYDLDDYVSQQSGVRTDSKFWTKQFLSGENYILKGFSVSGIGLVQATIDMDNATLVHGGSTADFSWYTAEDAPTDIIIPDADLTDGVKNYVELKIVTETNTPIVKAFWDPAANGGVGAEFNQEVDTQVDLKIEAIVLTGGFSGNPDRIKLAVIEVDGSGVITGILDKRDLFFRLGKGSNPNNSFTWASQAEPEITLTQGTVVGTFTTGETVTFSGGATAIVSQGGTTLIKIRLPSSDLYAAGNTVTGGSSGATAVLLQYQEAFTGADKDIDDFREMFEALTTEIKSLKGTSFWYEPGVGSLDGVYSQLNSVLVQNSTNARFYWTGSSLQITDDNGTPADADVVAYLTIFGNSQVLGLTRQDGTGGSSSITISDGQMLYITVPSSGNQDYSGVGSGAGNYKVIAVSSFTRSDENYWLAYRKGTKLYLRGLGELEAGEAQQVNDTTPDALKEFLGFDPEVATSVPYTTLPDVSLPGQFTTNSSIVEAVSANAENINLLNSTLTNLPYEEVIEIVASGATGNQLNGPVLVSTNITLPLDSRDGNSVEQYIVDAGALEIYLNGRYLRRGIDYVEVGTSGNLSQTIQTLKQLEVDDELTFRHALAGGIFFNPGGTTTLQDAYNNGRTITTVLGQPFEISGNIGDKLLKVNGDIDVSGVIDPKGITFSKEASNPLLSYGMDGIWVDANGNMMSYKHGTGSVNLTEIAEGNGGAAILQDSFLNNTISTIPAFTPVRIDSFGNLQLVDVTDENHIDAFMGITAEAIDPLESGKVAFVGRIANITTSMDVGKQVFIDKNGELTDIKPSIGVNNFEVGDYQIKVGIIIKNKDNPSNKDLLVRIGEPLEL